MYKKINRRDTRRKNEIERIEGEYFLSGSQRKSQRTQR